MRMVAYIGFTSFVVLMVIGVLIVGPLLAGDSGGRSPSSCPASVPAAQEHTAPEGPAASLKIGQATSIAFGRSTVTKDLPLKFALSSTVPPNTTAVPPDATAIPLNTKLDVAPDTFRRSDDARLDLCKITTTATVTSAQVVTLDIVFDRTGDRLGQPGTYSGSVTVNDQRLAGPVTVPVTLTMQYTHPGKVLWLLVFVVIPGSWLVWVTKTSRGAMQFALSPAWAEWVFTVGGLLTIATGTAAAVSVYVATYLKDPSWGTGVLQTLTLFGAMFSAFVAAAGVSHRYSTR